MIAELGLTAILIALGLFTRTGDLHFVCYEVNPSTRAEVQLGKITMTRKHRQMFATFSDWGPHHLKSKKFPVIALPDMRTPTALAILDSEEGMSGHSYVLTRGNSMKKRFHLSEDVADPSRLDYCRQVSNKEFNQD